MKFINLLFLLLSFNAFAQNTQTVKLLIVDQQSKNGIEGVNVSIPKYNLIQSSDKDGVVRFDGVPLGRFELETSSVHYGKQLFKELLLENAKQLVLVLELQPVGKELPEVQVTSQVNQSSLMNVEKITNEQIMRFPATFFDPARLVMAFAGVANTNDQANNVSVRGNAPEFVQWRMEGVEIVNPNHLSNAGMFSDKPAAAGGGTNILSAQMLGNMSFLNGAFSSDYSNALSGVFDMNLRTGNNEKFQHVLQVGLLGIDVSSEGPLNKKKGSSYLFNYRYSFTGLLSQAGVDFGGEKISFQDVAFNFNFPTKKSGTFTVFGMGGLSSNKFAPDADSTKWETDKDLNSIDFHGRMGLVGAKHNIKLFRKYNLHTVVVNSASENLRNAYSGNQNVNYDYAARNYLSFSTALSGGLNNIWAFNAGINGSYQFYKFNYIDTDNRFYSFGNLILSPFIKIYNREKARFNYNVGFAAPYYSLSNSQYFEPRVSANYYLKPQHQIKASYGLHSQVQTSRWAFELPFKPSRSHHFNLGYQFDIDKKQSVSAELFYQNMFNITKFDSLYVSTLNGYDYGFPAGGYYLMNQTNQGRNYGLELSYKHYLANGFFALVNATFYKAQFKGFDNKFYNSRFAGDYIYNLTVGKEWEGTNGKIFGLNTRVNWLGGFRDYKINTLEYLGVTYPYYSFDKGLQVKYDDYFRVDLRAYIKRTKKRGSETISLDLQNLTGRENAGFNYYDTYLKQVVNKKQLGLIPMVNYRWEF